jgi:hypothetical protein
MWKGTQNLKNERTIVLISPIFLWVGITAGGFPNLTLIKIKLLPFLYKFFLLEV